MLDCGDKGTEAQGDPVTVLSNDLGIFKLSQLNFPGPVQLSI